VGYALPVLLVAARGLAAQAPEPELARALLFWIPTALVVIGGLFEALFAGEARACPRHGGLLAAASCVRVSGRRLCPTIPAGCAFSPQRTSLTHACVRPASPTPDHRDPERPGGAA
jgi:hypothetical protein